MNNGKSEVCAVVEMFLMFLNLTFGPA